MGDLGHRLSDQVLLLAAAFSGARATLIPSREATQFFLATLGFEVPPGGLLGLPVSLAEGN